MTIVECNRLCDRRGIGRPARGGQPQVGYSLLVGPAAGTFASHAARALAEAGEHSGAEARHRAA
jgi:hypothetical protein